MYGVFSKLFNSLTINNPTFYTVTFEVLKRFFNVHTNIFNCSGRDLFQSKTLNNLIYLFQNQSNYNLK